MQDISLDLLFLSQTVDKIVCNYRFFASVLMSVWILWLTVSSSNVQSASTSRTGECPAATGSRSDARNQKIQKALQLGNQLRQSLGRQSTDRNQQWTFIIRQKWSRRGFEILIGSGLGSVSTKTGWRTGFLSSKSRLVFLDRFFKGLNLDRKNK